MFNFSFLITVLALISCGMQMHYLKLDAPCQLGRELLMGSPQESVGAWGCANMGRGKRKREEGESWAKDQEQTQQGI